MEFRQVLFMITLAILAGFLSGSLMFSPWIGLIILKKDILKVADGNPGASNVFRSGSLVFGILAMFLDYIKGFIPVFFFYPLASNEHLLLIPLVLAPVLGHAFSPFLGGKGGKSVAVSFGIWSGLTLWRIPSLMGGILILLSTVMDLKPDGWKVIVSMIGVLFYLFISKSPYSWYGIWLGNTAIFVYRYLNDLSIPPYFKRG